MVYKYPCGCFGLGRPPDLKNGEYQDFLQENMNRSYLYINLKRSIKTLLE